MPFWAEARTHHAATCKKFIERIHDERPSISRMLPRKGKLQPFAARRNGDSQAFYLCDSHSQGGFCLSRHNQTLQDISTPFRSRRLVGRGTPGLSYSCV